MCLQFHEGIYLRPLNGNIPPNGIIIHLSAGTLKQRELMLETFAPK